MSETETPSALPEPTREAALARLSAFTPAMGRHYATKRNFDFGPQDRSNVSGLSAHVRHRLILEEELVRVALGEHGLEGAQKFIEEVCWRSYWKGWLEMRPSVWSDYRQEVRAGIDRLDTDDDLKARYDAAVEGRTGIACFDAWTRELIETGYLHNHTRMWFASIWAFTLDLPWALGADFFYRHLMDGDAASNTLSWRWVCGLHTPGKTYLARASNIEKYTNGRFSPGEGDLAAEARALYEVSHPDPVPPKPGRTPDRRKASALLIHDEDLHPESWGVDGLDIRAVYVVAGAAHRSPLAAGERARDFTTRALEDVCSRAQGRFKQGAERVDSPVEAARRACEAGVSQLVTQAPPVGPMRDSLNGAMPGIEEAGLDLVEMRRAWDAAILPHATGGFFKLKKKIPSLLSRLALR